MINMPAEQILALLPLLFTVFLDAIDGSYFTGVFRALETDLGLTLSNIALMEGANSIATMIFTPIWAYIADQQILDRKMLLVVSCVGWGFTSILMGFFVTSFWDLLLFRVVNTAWNCSGLPIAQYYVGATIPLENRGKAFGLIGVGGSIGVVLCHQFSTAFSQQVLFGIAGWRFGLYFIGCLSMVSSGIMYVSLKEPPKEENVPKSLTSPLAIFSGLRDAWEVHSWRVLCIQGCFGCVAWQTLQFLTMWFQYCGFSDAQAGFIASMLPAGGFFGGLAGGILSDYLYKINPYHGRQFLAQFCVGNTVPLLAIMFTLVPQRPESATLFAVLMFTFGLSINMIMPGANKPLMAQTAPEGQKASLMSWEWTVEKLFGGLCGPPLVAWLSAACGYETTNLKMSEMSPDLRQHNATALAFMMRNVVCTCYICVVLVYSAMHWTFKRDMMVLHNQKDLENPERARLVSAKQDK